MFCCMVVEVDIQHAVRHTFRYSTTASTSLQTHVSMGSQVSMDCVVDIDVFPNCPMMMMKVWLSLSSAFFKSCLFIWRTNWILPLCCVLTNLLIFTQLRNPQMKRSSSQRENTVLRLKSVRWEFWQAKQIPNVYVRMCVHTRPIQE